MKSYITLLLFLFFLVSCSSNKKETINDSKELNSIWSISYYLDEFQDPTHEPYVVGEFVGNFSNSATTNDNLNVQVMVDSTTVRFRFFEYGNQLLKDANGILFRYKTQDGVTGEIRLWSDSYGYIDVFDSGAWKFRSFIYDDVVKLRELLVNNSTIKFSCSNTEYNSNTYNFEINTSGLIEMLKKANIPLKMPPYPGQ